MPNLVRAEMYRLVRSRALWISVLLATLMACGYFTSAHLLATGRLDASATGGLSGLSDYLAVWLLGPVLIGVLVAGDFENRTMHDRVLASPRRAVVAAKTLTAAAVVAAVMAPYAVGSVVCLASGEEFTLFLPTTPLAIASVAPSTGLSLATVLRSLLILAVWGAVMLSRLAFCLVVAFWTRRALVVAGAGFGAGFLLDALATMVSRHDLGHRLLALTPYADRAHLTLASSWGDVAGSLLVAVLYTGAWAVVATVVFRRADIP